MSDIGKNTDDKSKNFSYLNVLKFIGILICVGIIIWQSIELYQDNQQYAIADKEYQQLLNSQTKIDGTEAATPEEDYPHLQVNYSQLKSINEDFVCWVYFPFFDISYPVVQETEIDEYLKKTFDGTYNSSGCLFTDIYSSPNFTGMHDIIFGHNMRNGSMFGKFKRLVQSSDEDISKNPYVYIYTEDVVYKYEVFAYYITTVGSPAYDVVSTDEQYDDFLTYIRNRTAYPFPTDLDFSNRPSILTLSTCNGRTGSGRRLVIHTVKIGAWPNE